MVSNVLEKKRQAKNETDFFFLLINIYTINNITYMSRSNEFISRILNHSVKLKFHDYKHGNK